MTSDTQVTLNGLTDQGHARLLGHELRLVREARGWTRVQLVKRLPSGIGDRTLLSYESGIRLMTVVRLIEICGALEVAPSAILDRAMEKARDPRGYTLKVNLRAIVRDRQEGVRVGSVLGWDQTP